MDTRPAELDPNEALMRELVFPEEELRLLTSVTWRGEFRWFRSPNVVPIERAKQKREKVDSA
jgi:hypothetical protein